jgi:hypothetical protein
VDLKDVTPTSLLKDRVREVEGNPDFSNKDIGSSQQMVSEVKSSLIPTLNQVELPLEVAGPAHPGGHSRVLSQVCVACLSLIYVCLYIYSFIFVLALMCDWFSMLLLCTYRLAQ